MIITWKTRHKSTKHGEITSGSRGGSRTTTCSSMWQHYRNKQKTNKNFFIHLPLQ